MFWMGFTAGFSSCLALAIGDYWYAGYRTERSTHAAFFTSLTQDQKKQLLSFEGMGDWRQFRDLVEIEKPADSSSSG